MILNFAEKNGYSVISDFDCASVGEIRDIIDKKDISVLVFASPVSLKADSEFSELMKDMPCVTIFAAESMQEYKTEDIMDFDIRLSRSPYIIDNIAVTDEFLEKYRIICGDRNAYKLKKAIDSGETKDFRSELAYVVPAEDDFMTDVDKYISSALKDKTDYQIKAVASCLALARRGDGNAVLNEESKQFYKLIKAKTEV